MKARLQLFFTLLLLPHLVGAQCPSPSGDQVSYGNGTWIGYVYDGADNFTSNYFGFITEPQQFDDFSTGDSLFTSDCALEKTTFSVRFRMNETFACGNYAITIGGDDGVRLSLDGGNTFFINGYVNQPYATYTDTVLLDGNYDFVLEYFENAGLNRVSFAITALGTSGDGGSIGSDQSFCSLSSATLDPNAFVSQAAAGFCTGLPSYQWQISSDNISFSNIGGATSETYDPPSGFPAGETRYYRRQATNGAATFFSNTVSIVSDTAQGDQVTYGNNSWIGYVYDGVNNFSDYQGFITESQFFDESFGGNTTTFAVNGCDVFTETFSVRFRMNQNFTCGVYTFTIGGDDGVRLSVDGGNTYLISDYTNHAYRTSSASIQLDGSTDLVLDYFENGGGNRVSFTYSFSPTVGGGGDIDGSQSFCTAASVDPAAFTSVVDASFCSGNPPSYQWQESVDNTTFTNIVGANTNTFDLTTFPAATTRFYRRLGIDGTDTVFSDTLTVTNLSVAGDEVSFGNGNWIGYFYDGVNNFNTVNYQGFATEPEQFDQSFGGTNTDFTINGCPVNTETFTVRYKMQQTFASGTYEITIGGDDGVRLSIDGGNTYLINGYVNQAYTTYTATTTLSGTVDLVLEYYEQNGGNRVSFSYALTSGTNWTGAVNTDWSNVGNWSAGVPDCTIDAVILGTASNMPTISADVNVRSIIIESGATLTIAGTNSLSLCGDWNNQGSFVANESTVNFVDQGVARSIQTVATQTFYNLQLNDGAGTALQGASSQVHRGLTMTDGDLNTNGLLTLLSDASSTGYIGPIPTGHFVTGEVEVQRFIATTTGYNQLASPIQNTTLEMWDDDLITSGFSGSDFPTFPFVNVQNYDETVFGDKDNFGWIDATSITETVETGTGRMVYLGPSSNVMFDAQGTINQGSVVFNLTYTDDPGQPASQDGWNMVGNPFPCTIDWLAPTGWTKTNLNNAVQVWRADLNQFATFVNGVATNGGSRYIPSSQGFWVQSNASNPGMAVTEDVKSGEQGTFLRTDPGQLIRLALVGEQFSDETVVRFVAGAQEAFDPQLDGQKLHSPSPEVPSLSSVDQDRIEYSIQSLPTDLDQVWIPLNLKIPAHGTYTFELKAFSAIDQVLFIEDQSTGQFWPLQTGFELSLTLEEGQHEGRFIIRSAKTQTPKAVTNEQLAITPNPFVINQGFDLQLTELSNDAPLLVQLVDLRGNVLQEQNLLIAAGQSTLHIQTPDLAPGTYLIQVHGEQGVWQQKMVAIRF